METSASLLDRLAQSPCDADWRRLHDLYAPLLGAWLHRAGIPEHDRDDLSQEVLMIVVKKVSEFDHRGPGAFRSWLRSILSNRIGDYIRSERGRVSADGGSAARDQLEALADSESPLSRLWDREHDAHVVGRAMARVRPDFADLTWEAFSRQARDGRPAREVAVDLGISVNAVLVAKSRVLRRLRAELAGLI